MQIFPANASEDDVRVFIRSWVSLLAAGDYAGAVAALSPEIPDGSGSTNHRSWTPELLKAVINHYGADEPWGDDWRYTVAPLEGELLEAFDESLDVDFSMWSRTGPDGSLLAGAVHADLPLIFSDGSGMSDLTARFMFKHLPGGERVLVLLDIHML